MDIVDMKHVCGLARAHGITSVVDNAFATAVLQRPLDFGADVVAYSATKLMDGQGRVLRSEEHTSELQSLMRISYAVFCLKKKKQLIHLKQVEMHQLTNTTQQHTKSR